MVCMDHCELTVENARAYLLGRETDGTEQEGLFDRARGRIVGSEQYLTKPFTKDELLGAVSNQIG